MPVDGTLIFDTEIDRSGIEKGSKLAKSDLEKLGTQVKDIFSSKSLTSGLADLGGKLVGAFAFAKLTQGLGQVATAAIKYNAQMEAYQTNFSVMLGDEAKGVEYVAQLREKAAKTPFGMEDLASAAQTMLSFGMDAENANTAMDRLGDIALGNKDKFQSLSLAFSQISAAGKLTGEDLLQMVNAGFNPLNTLAEKTGTSLGDLKDVMSGGKGSAAFRKQMKDAQNEVKKLGAGASEGAYADLASTGWDHIDGVQGANSGNYYYRVQERINNAGYEHSLFIDMDSAAAYAKAMNCRFQHEDYQNALSFAGEPLTDGTPASQVTVHFRTSKTTSFTYDAGTKLYTGAQYGSDWVDGNDGTALTFRNLLVLGAETKTIDDYGRLAVTLTGKGEGHLIRDGQCVPITWSREKEDMPFTYTFADGSPATLAAGKTYVAVVPPESALDLE